MPKVGGEFTDYARFALHREVFNRKDRREKAAKDATTSLGPCFSSRSSRPFFATFAVKGFARVSFRERTNNIL
jgi:hypothetical protein